LCLNECLPGGPGCARSTWCGAHDVWRRAQEALAAVLGAESLDRLAGTATRKRAQLNMPDSALAAAGVAADA
jgi:DNA-binding IscR family transcriptional regulator